MACTFSSKSAENGLKRAAAPGFHDAHILDAVANPQPRVRDGDDRPAVETQVFDRHPEHVVLRIQAGEGRSGQGLAGHGDVLENHVPAPAALGIVGVAVLLDDDDEQVRNVSGLRVGAVALSALPLHHRPQVGLIHVHADIFVANAVYRGPVPVLNVHGDVRGPDDIDVAADDVSDFRGGGFGPDLQRASPVTPEHQAADANVSHRPVVVTLPGPLEPFQHDAVVERADEGVVDGHVLTVADVYPVGVVPPEADQLDAGDNQFPAAERAQAPDVWIAQNGTVDLHIRTVRQPDRSAALPTLELAGVDDAAPEDPGTGNAASLDRRVDHRPSGDVNRLAAFQADLPGPVDAGAEVLQVRSAAPGNVGFRRIGEKVQRVMRSVQFQRQLPRPAHHLP